MSIGYYVLTFSKEGDSVTFSSPHYDSVIHQFTDWCDSHRMKVTLLRPDGDNSRPYYPWLCACAVRLERDSDFVFRHEVKINTTEIYRDNPRFRRDIVTRGVLEFSYLEVGQTDTKQTKTPDKES